MDKNEFKKQRWAYKAANIMWRDKMIIALDFSNLLAFTSLLNFKFMIALPW
jgi:hypothetical protein